MDVIILVFSFCSFIPFFLVIHVIFVARDLIEFGWMDCCVIKCDVERQMYYSCFDLGVAVASKIDISPSTMYFSTILSRAI